MSMKDICEEWKEDWKDFVEDWEHRFPHLKWWVWKKRWFPAIFVCKFLRRHGPLDYYDGIFCLRCGGHEQSGAEFTKEDYYSIFRKEKKNDG